VAYGLLNAFVGFWFAGKGRLDGVVQEDVIKGSSVGIVGFVGYILVFSHTGIGVANLFGVGGVIPAMVEVALVVAVVVVVVGSLGIFMFFLELQRHRPRRHESIGGG